MSTDTTEKKSGGRAGLLLLLILVIAGAGAVFYFMGGTLTGGNKIIDPNVFIRAQNDLVLRPDDFDANYKIPVGEEARFSNDQVQYDRGQNEGKTYITTTGRVDGYMLHIERVSSTDITPASFESTVEVFETTDGASLVFSDEWLWVDINEKWDLQEESSCDIGDECQISSYIYYDQAANLTSLRYDVFFRYHNVVAFVSGRSLEVDINAQSVLDAAQTLHDKLAALELVAAK